MKPKDEGVQAWGSPPGPPKRRSLLPFLVLGVLIVVAIGIAGRFLLGSRGSTPSAPQAGAPAGGPATAAPSPAIGVLSGRWEVSETTAGDPDRRSYVIQLTQTGERLTGSIVGGGRGGGLPGPAVLSGKVTDRIVGGKVGSKRVEMEAQAGGKVTRRFFGTAGLDLTFMSGRYTGPADQITGEWEATKLSGP